MSREVKLEDEQKGRMKKGRKRGGDLGHMERSERWKDRMSRNAWLWQSECDEMNGCRDETTVTKCMAVRTNKFNKTPGSRHKINDAKCPANKGKANALKCPANRNNVDVMLCQAVGTKRM